METNSLNNNVSANNDSVNKTFRLKRNVVRRIEADAKRAGISTNGLVSNILARYVEWDRVADEIGFVSLAPNMVQCILETSTVELMSKAGKMIAERSCFKDVGLHFFQEYNAPTFLKLALLFQKYANNYRVQGESTHGEVSDLSFYHDLGKKWSSFVGLLMHNELARLGLEHSYEVSDNAVVFKLAKNIEVNKASILASPRA